MPTPKECTAVLASSVFGNKMKLLATVLTQVDLGIKDTATADQSPVCKPRQVNLATAVAAASTPPSAPSIAARSRMLWVNQLHRTSTHFMFVALHMRMS
jgi:hypothetical protein